MVMKSTIIILGLIALAAAAPKVNEKLDPRIINGHEATPHSIPYQAFIEIYNGSEYQLFCGGSLISENYVLTAAHCCIRGDRAHLILGAHNLVEIEDTKVDLNSTNMTSHAGYHTNPIVNDLCVIKLPQTINLTDAVKTVPLASGSGDFAGSKAIATGWGEINGTAHIVSSTLNEVELEVISMDDCHDSFSSLDSSVLCASGSDGESICEGDSGGPLVTDGVLIGVSSFSVVGCYAGYPSVFTRVTSFVDWIKENTDLL